MKKIFLFLFSLMLPLIFVGCADQNKLSAPSNFNVASNGIVRFEQVPNANSYTLNVNDNEYKFDLSSRGVSINTQNNKNVVSFDAGRFFELGQTYNVKIKANNSELGDSAYTTNLTYTHTITLSTPGNVKIEGETLTWDAVENATAYMVKMHSLLLPSGQPPVYTFETNSFNFSTIISNAGEYSFSVCAISNNNFYLDSPYSALITYSATRQLNTPQNGYIYKENGQLHLVTVLDVDADFVKVEISPFSRGTNVDADFVSRDCNLVEINLNEMFKQEILSGQLNFADENQLKFVVSSANENNLNLLTSNRAEILFQNNFILPSPVLTMQQNSALNKKVLSWGRVAGATSYTLVLIKDGVKTTLTLTSQETNFVLEQEIDFAYIYANGYNNILTSPISNVVTNSSATLGDLNFRLENNSLTWNDFGDATYILEIANQKHELKTNQFDLLSLTAVEKSATLTVLKKNYQAKTQTLSLNYNKKLASPSGLNFVSQYSLNFASNPFAIGYKIYLTDKSGNQSAINEIFTTNTIDLSSYIIKQGEYSSYVVEVQAIAPIGSGYLDSEITTSRLEVTHYKVLDEPQFDNEPVYLDANGNYYLSFRAVNGAYEYEILINNNLIATILADSRAQYVINISEYLTEANSYNIVVRAKGEPNSEVKPSQSEYKCVINKQLSTVTNIVVTERDGIYTLSFTQVENARAYQVKIVKINDSSYDEYLASIGLSNNFTVYGAINITDYVTQAGEYDIFITALASTNGYYTDSAMSDEYAVVNKLSTLKVPTGTGVDGSFELNKINKEIIVVSWMGDENADYYLVKVVNPFGDVKEFRTTNNIEELNVSSFFTVEGRYQIAVKAMVNPTGDNAKTFVSSRYSDITAYRYNYEQEFDFERYSISWGGKLYNYKIENINQLTAQLWNYYLFNDVERLSLIVPTSADKNLRQTITALADECSAIKMHNFAQDSEWLNLTRVESTASDLDLFKYLVKTILNCYPDLAVLDGLTVSLNNNIFHLTYNNLLDDNKFVQTPTEVISPEADFANQFEYLSDFERRGNSVYFPVDALVGARVSTTEQLLQVILNGNKPIFNVSGSDAEIVYENAKAVLRAINTKNMSDLEKATRIYDWLMYAYNLNTNAQMQLVGEHLEPVDISVYGTRQEFYLEGIFLNLNNEQNANFDGEFYLGNKNATAYSFAKAFTLLCNIEGIKTINAYGTIENSYIESANHVWNKIFLDTSNDDSELKSWYAVDVTYSDYNYQYRSSANKKNIASHINFLVAESTLYNRLGLNEVSYLPTDNITAENSYDYYSFNNFSLTEQQILNTINQDNSNDANVGDYYQDGIMYSRKYDQSIDYKSTPRTSGNGVLQKYLFNALVYLKYNLCYQNSGSGAVFEFETSALTLVSETDVRNMIDTINTYFRSSTTGHNANKPLILDDCTQFAFGSNTVYVITVHI